MVPNPKFSHSDFVLSERKLTEERNIHHNKFGGLNLVYHTDSVVSIEFGVENSWLEYGQTEALKCRSCKLLFKGKTTCNEVWLLIQVTLQSYCYLQSC